MSRIQFKNRILQLSILINAVLFMISCGTATQNESRDLNALKENALLALHNVLNNQEEWVKVHAAEFLVWTGHKDSVRPVFLEEEKTLGTKNQYRIGIWRVLAQDADNVETKKLYTDKILQAFLDTAGQDRIHAAETLAKLGISPMQENAGITLQTLGSPVKSLALYTRWAAAYTSADSIAPVQKSFYRILMEDAQEMSVRKLAAFVLRKMGTVSEEDWINLAEKATHESVNEDIKLSLLHTALITAPQNMEHQTGYKNVLSSLLRFKDTATKAVRVELASALAEKGNTEHLPYLLLLMNNEEPLGNPADDADVQAYAAWAVLRIAEREEKSER